MSTYRAITPRYNPPQNHSGSSFQIPCERGIRPLAARPRREWRERGVKRWVWGWMELLNNDQKIRAIIEGE